MIQKDSASSSCMEFSMYQSDSNNSPSSALVNNQYHDSVIGDMLSEGRVVNTKLSNGLDSDTVKIVETNPDYVVKVLGMMCQKNCAKTVQNSLKNLPSVSWATVSYEESNAKIWGTCTLADVIDAIESVGFEASLWTSDATASQDLNTPIEFPDHILEVKNMMNSESCPKRIKSVLLSLDGVLSVSVNFHRRLVSVWGFAEIDAIIKCLFQIGYSAEVSGEGGCDEAPDSSSPHADCYDTERLNYIESERLPELQHAFEFRVSGMSCANCALQIEKMIKSKYSVKEACVSCVTEKALVIPEPVSGRQPDPLEIMRDIESLGYGCEYIPQSGTTSKDVTTDEYSNAKSWLGLLTLALVLGVPMMTLHFAAMSSDRVHAALDVPFLCRGRVPLGQSIMLVLSVVMQVGVGQRYYRSAFVNLKHGNFGMDFLVVTGSTITFLYNISKFTNSCYFRAKPSHMFLESSGMLLMFVTLGKFLESYAKGSTVSAISSLSNLQPKTVISPQSQLFTCRITLR